MSVRTCLVFETHAPPLCGPRQRGRTPQSQKGLSGDSGPSKVRLPPSFWRDGQTSVSLTQTFKIVRGPPSAYSQGWGTHSQCQGTVVTFFPDIGSDMLLLTATEESLTRDL